MHTRLVYSGDVGLIHHVWCDEDREEQTPEEESSVAQVVYPRSGVFVREVRRRVVVAHPAVAVFYNPGEVGRIRHPVSSADSSTTFTPSSQVLNALVGSSDELPDVAAPVEGKAVIDHARLREELARETQDRLEIDELALALMTRAARVPRAPSSPTVEARQRRIANDATQVLAGRFRENVGLGELAAQTGSSAFEVSRALNRTFGRTVAETRTMLRISHVVAHINDDGASLADLAADAGFADQAHMTRVFRRHLGATPTKLRRHLTAIPRKIVQDLH